jgi:UDP-N-acetylenolpyruvoylglucosamine reductase
LYEVAQWRGRRSSSSRREMSFGSAFKSDSTTFAGKRVSAFVE